MKVWISEDETMGWGPPKRRQRKPGGQELVTVWPDRKRHRRYRPFSGGSSESRAVVSACDNAAA